MRNELLTAALGGLFSMGAGSAKGEIVNRTTRVGTSDYVYQLYVPKAARRRATAGQTLPVIVFLHGIGQRGSGGFVPTQGAIGSLVRHYFGQVPALVLLPQCRPGSYWSDPVMEEMTMQALAASVAEFGADERRIYLTGVSMGGYGVWHFAFQHPEKFAALVSICGGSSLTTGDRFAPLAEHVRATPAWLFHGADDRVVQVSESRNIVAALRAAGNERVTYSEYAGVGHNVWLNVIGEKSLLPWLLAQSI